MDNFTFYEDSELEKEISLNQIINQIYITILKKLKLIASLEIDETICVSIESKMKHDRIMTAFWRTYYNDNRNKTIEWIEAIFNEYKIHIKDLEKQKTSYNKLKLESKYNEMIFNLNEIFNRAIKGLQNLKITYQDDETVIAKIDKIVSENS